MINEEVLKLPEGRQSLTNIFVGGISQGAMLSFAALLRYPFKTPLGGVICLIGINPYDIEG